jgi:hypothetical protein
MMEHNISQSAQDDRFVFCNYKTDKECQRMKKHLVGLAAMVLMFGISGCAKEPVEEIRLTRTAVEAVVQEDGEKYAAEELLILKKDVAKAMDEIRIQNDSFLKDFDQAKQMLAKVTIDSEQLKPVIASRKEEARQKAVAAQESAYASITQAGDLLSVAPEGKGSSAEIEAMSADLKGLFESMPEVRELIDSGDYASAAIKAVAVSEIADQISAEVKQALEKVALEQAERERIARENAVKATKEKRTSRK